MKSAKLGLEVASALAALFCIAHVLRLVAVVEVRVGEMLVSPWVSVVVVLAAGALSVWFWRLAVAQGETHLPPVSHDKTVTPAPL